MPALSAISEGTESLTATEEIEETGTYPSDDLYPAENLYPEDAGGLVLAVLVEE